MPGHSPTAYNAATPEKSKMAGRGSKIDDGIQKGVSHRPFCLTSYSGRQTKSRSNQNIILAKSDHFPIIFDLGSLSWLGAIAVSAALQTVSECPRH